MDREAAFKAVQDFISMEEPQSGNFTDRHEYARAKQNYEMKMKAAMVSAFIIAAEAFNDFKRIADALTKMSEPPVLVQGESLKTEAQPPQIVYAGPRPFRIVGNVAETFDPEAEKGPDLFNRT